ncbi:hypothetical protein EJ357_22575 [Streptomyces cyaneochromogenes]|uniref:Uncharacterized protein n=1 Tax=Streptomyces cyaneochromogenes TaxID=2496836 RepID=A0A3S9M9U0_9ACTN|nr:hypothetical protein [Streptomyces cyaneochromogenes]AZQ35920.1 hypothetical protein EJ357_22575 [Streptomyces cyaneochromogenes]
MQDTVQTARESSTEKTPALEPRTITYPVKTGGSLTTPCPAWCTSDHSDDVARGIHPADLLHQGEPVRLDYNADGIPVSVLQARLGQWPFSGDPEESVPYVEITPEVGTGASVYCHNRLELDDEIRKVRAHLQALIDLGDQLAEAQAVDHSRHVTDGGTAWSSLGRTDVQSLPIAYLLKVYGVKVVETEDTGRKAVAALYGEPGAMELRVKPDMSQYMREDQARRLLLDWYEAHIGGAA